MSRTVRDIISDKGCITGHSLGELTNTDKPISECGWLELMEWKRVGSILSAPKWQEEERQYFRTPRNKSR